MRARTRNLAVVALHALAAAASAEVMAEGVIEAEGHAAKIPWTFDVGGRIQLDNDSFDGLYSVDGQKVSVTYLRSARIDFSATIGDRWEFRLSLEPTESDSALLDTLIAAYRGLGPLTLTAGRFKPGFGLEQATSSRWTTGIERSSIWDLAPDATEREDSWGFEASALGEHQYASAGYYDKPTGHAQALRVAYAPLLEAQRVLHLGASYSREDIDTSSGRIRTRLGVRGVSEDDAGSRVTLATRNKGAFDSDSAAVVEFAYVQGPFSVQAEALQRRLGSSGAAAPRTARGQYVQLAWTLSGETRPYKIDGAKFGALRPAGDWGAWEVFYRYDRLVVDGGPDLLGDGRTRSSARLQVLGLNWYATRKLRLALNYLWGYSDGLTNDLGDTDGRALSLRLQVLY